HPEHPAEGTDVFAEHQHSLVGGHRLVECAVERVHHREFFVLLRAGVRGRIQRRHSAASSRWSSSRTSACWARSCWVGSAYTWANSALGSRGGSWLRISRIRAATASASSRNRSSLASSRAPCARR